ncbi:unnamed protein product, partial [marine sediment metagenome]
LSILALPVSRPVPLGGKDISIYSGIMAVPQLGHFIWRQGTPGEWDAL